MKTEPREYIAHEYPMTAIAPRRCENCGEDIEVGQKYVRSIWRQADGVGVTVGHVRPECAIDDDGGPA